jgi:hypothetical protein
MFDTLDDVIDHVIALAVEQHESKRRHREVKAERPGSIKLAEADFLDAEFTGYLERYRDKMKTALVDFLRFPPFHPLHRDRMGAFKNTGEYERSVFIMTKFPTQDDPAGVPLQKVIESVQEAVEAHGFVPRLASDTDFHSDLWGNVELYLLGSCCGIAIVEDRFQTQVNPNVAMEWGWMRGTGKGVLFLIDSACKHRPADIAGLLRREFDWDNPAEKIQGHVKDFLARQGH